MYKVVYAIKMPCGNRREFEEPATTDRAAVIAAVCTYRLAGIEAWIEPAK